MQTFFISSDATPADPTSSSVALNDAQSAVVCTIVGEATMQHTVSWSIAGTVYEGGATVLDAGTLTTSLVLGDVTVDILGLEVSSTVLWRTRGEL